MQGARVLITGGTDGMGKALAIALAKKGTRLLLMGRSRDKGEAAVAEVSHTSGNESVKFLQGDLSLVREMRQAAVEAHQQFDGLDVLVHSAGGLFPGKRTLTNEGLELSFAVQFLARFVLTNELVSLLRAAPVAQVLSIAGGGYGTVDLDDLQSERGYGRFKAIARTSAMNDLLTVEQISRYPDITFYDYGPGLVRTAVSMPNALMRLLVSTIGRPLSRSPEQAADEMVALLTGDYPSGLYGVSLKRNDAAEANLDVADRTKLWDYSEKIVANQITT